MRYVGFTGHKDPAVHLRMVAVAQEHGFRFDTAQMPLDVLDAHFRRFGKQVVPVLLKQGVGGPGDEGAGRRVGAQEQDRDAGGVPAVRAGLPTSVVSTGIDSPAILEQELADLLATTRPAASKGEFERFQTTNAFDGTAKNPSWLGDHDKGPG